MNIVNKTIVILLAVAAFYACDKKIVRSDKFDPAIDPAQIMRNAEIVQSDSGILQTIIFGQEILQYDDEMQTQVFPKGIKVTVFNDKHNPNVIVTANEATNYTKDDLMVARGNVVIKDFRKGDTIYTEEVFWDQKKRTLRSEKHVKQIGRSGRLEGTGFDSDEEMENFRLRNPRGTFNLD